VPAETPEPGSPVIQCRPRAISLTAAGTIDLRSLLSHRFALVRAQDALGAAARRSGLQVIVEPSTS
jgi:threonine dehydrogenase-like Zn-dependent dehydrogenase